MVTDMVIYFSIIDESMGEGITDVDGVSLANSGSSSYPIR